MSVFRRSGLHDLGPSVSGRESTQSFATTFVLDVVDIYVAYVVGSDRECLQMLREFSKCRAPTSLWNMSHAPPPFPHQIHGRKFSSSNGGGHSAREWHRTLRSILKISSSTARSSSYSVLLVRPEKFVVSLNKVSSNCSPTSWLTHKVMEISLFRSWGIIVVRQSVISSSKRSLHFPMITGLTCVREQIAQEWCWSESCF